MSTTPDEKLDVSDKSPSAFNTRSFTVDESGDMDKQHHALVRQLKNRHIAMIRYVSVWLEYFFFATFLILS